MCQKGYFPIRRLEFSPKHSDSEKFYNLLKRDVGSAAACLSITKKITDRMLGVGEFLKSKKIGLGEAYYEPAYTTESLEFEIHLEDYLTNNWAIFEKKRYKAVMFLFDEFHTVSDIPEKDHHVLTDFIGTINELQDRGIKYYLALSGLPKLPLNIKAARSYSERMFKTIVVEKLSKDAAGKAITIPLKDTPCRFEKKTCRYDSK